MNNRFQALGCQLLWWTLVVACLWGCTGRLMPAAKAPDQVSKEHVMVVTATAEDTWASLARTHLNDSTKAWYLAVYNDNKPLGNNTQVMIPLFSEHLGGLTAQGYQTVPVLVYTAIADAGNAPGVSAANFKIQMTYLKDNGYVPISLDRLLHFLQFKEQLPPKSVVLTFDTAQHWIYDTVWPLLQQYQFPAALFVSTQPVGNPGALTWEELAQMAAGGLTVGTSGHTLASFADATLPKGSQGGQGYTAAKQDILAASEAIKTHLDRDCRYFAYPDGRTNDMVIALLKQYGFVCGFTRNPGANPFFADDFRLQRTAIDATMNLKQFQHQLKVFQAADLK